MNLTFLSVSAILKQGKVGFLQLFKEGKMCSHVFKLFALILGFCGGFVALGHEHFMTPENVLLFVNSGILFLMSVYSIHGTDIDETGPYL